MHTNTFGERAGNSHPHMREANYFTITPDFSTKLGIPTWFRCGLFAFGLNSAHIKLKNVKDTIRSLYVLYVLS